MKFKGVTKKDTVKKKVPQKIDKRQRKNDLKKEEIKEVVRETIEELAQEPDVQQAPQKNNQTGENVLPHSASFTNNSEKTTEIPQLPIVENSNLTGNDSSITQEADIPLLPTVPVESTPVVADTPVTDDNASDTKNTGGYVKKLLFLAISAIVIVMVALGAFWYVTTHNLLALKAELLHTQQVAPTVVKATPTPTPTPKPVNLSAYTIMVLNGSYLSGEAAKAKTVLVSAGFTVGSIGNASSHTATETVIAAKTTVDQSYLNKLMQTLENTYVVSQQVQTLPDSTTSDVVVTIGSSLK